MTRILMIPVAGTIAALVAILLAREPRGEAAQPELPPFDFPDAPEHAETPDEEELPGEEPTDVEMEPEEAPAPEPREFQLRLESDGTLLDSESGATYASIDDLAKQIGDARHTLVIANGEGVPKAALDEAEARLRDRFTVRKVYRAPETPPGEDR